MVAEILKEISTLRVLLAVISIYVISKFIAWYRNPLRKIPGPKGSLIFGNTTDIRSPHDGHQVLVEWGRKYGDIFKTWSVIETKVDGTTMQYRYFPFSRGPRMCIGYRFAEAELKPVLAQILREFSFKLGKNQARDFKGEVVLALRPSPSPMVEIFIAG